MSIEYERVKERLHQVITASRNGSFPTTPINHIPETSEYHKFTSVEMMINTMIGYMTETLTLVGIGKESILELYKKKPSGRMYLRIERTEECEFQKVITNSEKKERGSGSGILNFVVSRTVLSDKWVWDYSYSHTAILASGDEEIIVWRGNGSETIQTDSEDPPRPRTSILSPLELELTWLSKHLSKKFTISTDSPFCKTPTNNEPVNHLLSFVDEVEEFSETLREYFIQINKMWPPTAIDIVPLVTDYESRCLPLIFSASDQEIALQSFKQILHNEIAEIADSENISVGLLRVKEHIIVSALGLLVGICGSVHACLNYIDNEISAIISKLTSGEVLPAGLDKAIEWFVNKKMYSDSDSKHLNIKPMAVVIRNQNTHPEGLLTITDSDTGRPLKVVSKTVNHQGDRISWSFNISACATIGCKGPVTVSGCVRTVVRSDTSKKMLSLTSNQLSSFIIVMGKLNGVGKIIPSHAMIVRNRDELNITLLFNEIPSAAEFQEAISSLSPEQQRFANAYRGMQLEGTLFALGIIHTKPQLEVVLNLPRGSLTKELALSEKLLDLLLVHGVSADFLSASSHSPSAVDSVRRNCASIYTLIDKEKEDELMTVKRKQEIQKLRERGIVDIETRKQWRQQYIRSVWGPCVQTGSIQLCCASAPKKSGFFAPARASSKSKGFSFSSLSRSSEGNRFIAPSKPKPNKVPVISKPSAKINEVIADKALCEASGEVAPPEEPSQPEPEPEPEPEQEACASTAVATSATADKGWDYSSIPAKLEKRFAEITTPGSNVRPVIITPDPSGWSQSTHPSILSTTPPPLKKLLQSDIKRAKQSAFDLIDAITKSGSVPLCETSLHVLFGFNNNWNDGVIQSAAKHNINPLNAGTETIVEVINVLHDTQ
eukprot:TRINITY_DN1793_c2_g1_i2.p1 TRINITY_DN1793_c2_g1~~TRINITY_DN1793_c2_g1_i2.p1  ORF type:complete len:890 (+),score=147.47 TRINITY_DN1793_c2_g1_i2:152-2821(+)